MTEYGKLLRKIRIDNSEVLYDMAKKLGITSSYLSAIECGKRVIPVNFSERISELYSLDDFKSEQLQKQQDSCSLKLEIQFDEEDKEDKELAFKFARTFRDIDEEDRIAILKILNKRRRDKWLNEYEKHLCNRIRT